MHFFAQVAAIALFTVRDPGDVDVGQEVDVRGSFVESQLNPVRAIAVVVVTINNSAE